MFRSLPRNLFLLALFLVSNLALAQPGDPGGDPDQPVPISGLGYLLAAGAALGISRLRKSFKSKEE